MFDRNGKLDYNEFQSIWQYINDWTSCFRSFDRDNSGSIDRCELIPAFTQFGKGLHFLSFFFKAMF